MDKNVRAVIYARFSSDNQREESIEAQVRACKYYAQQKKMDVVEVYADRAKSGRRIKGRDDFLRMIKDGESKNFDVVLVHKLNRFGRDVYDTYDYKKRLEENNIYLVSVTENLENTAEGRLMLGVISAMNQFYSENLSNEVMKGMKENALKADHTGGPPPYGFSLNVKTRKLVINEDEAPAVRLIFKRYVEGYSYRKIIDELNSLGFVTKRGVEFKPNSIYSILENEKYSGTYVFNKRSSQKNGKRNNHLHKDESEIIRIENGCPQIISKELWNQSQAKKKTGCRTGGRNCAKQIYLLSGLVYCGGCGGRMTGNHTKNGVNKVPYTSYRCENRNCTYRRQIKCDWVDSFVLSELERIVFSEEQIPFLLEKMREIEESFKTEEIDFSKDIKNRLGGVESKINNIINSIANGNSQDIFADKLKELHEEKRILTERLHEQSNIPKASKQTVINEENIYKLFAQYKEFVKTKNLPECKKFINTYVQKVTLTPDDVDVIINVPSLFEKEFNMRMNTSTPCKPLKIPQNLNVGGKLVPVVPMYSKDGFSGVIKMAEAN